MHRSLSKDSLGLAVLGYGIQNEFAQSEVCLDSLHVFANINYFIYRMKYFIDII